jgi:hypothetical protein
LNDFGPDQVRTSINELKNSTKQMQELTQVESVSRRACDELYLVISTLCTMLETFYRPLLPATLTGVLTLLHDDILKLSQ